MKSILEKVYDTVYPPRCPVCDGILYDKKSSKRPLICKECVGKIKFIDGDICLKCGKLIEDSEEEFCHDCIKKHFEFKRGVAAFAYSKEMKRSMYGFKYNNRREYGKFYAQSIWDLRKEVIFGWDCDAIIPVPLHIKRQRKRGYNQAKVLAQYLESDLKLPIDDKILFRTKNTIPQKELETKGRKNNIDNAFQTTTNVVKYSKVILVDDIYTTGATINECARVLKLAGVKEVYFVTACIGNGF